MTPTEKALKYAEDITAERVPACKWVKLACERFLRDLKRQDNPEYPFIYDTAKADRAVKFMELMPHVKGKWARDKLKLSFEPWQCFIECNLFGWVNKVSKHRRFRKSFELIPRKNAKSTRAAARGIYMFICDDEAGAEVYSGATTEKQAFEIYKPAWMMAQSLPKMRERFGIELTGNTKNPGTMFTAHDMSKFEVLIGKPGDGASPHCALIDEYHEHDTDHMVDTMETGMGAREQPMLCIVTTAGSNLSGPCYAMQQDMQRILEGVVEDEVTFAIMYGIDKEDKWDDPASLIKANPNYGISVFPEFLAAQLAQAKRSARKQNSFRTKHLNEWVGANTAWMNMVAWMRQIAWIDISTGKIGSHESFPHGSNLRIIQPADFKDCPVRLSTDLSSKKDAVAVDMTFKRGHQYFSFKKFFVPEAALEDNEKYQEFKNEERSCLEITEGYMTDQEAIEEYLLEMNKVFNVIDFTFDAWNADYIMNNLMKKKLNVVKFPFRTQFVSGPMKTVEAAVLDGQYWHDGNPMQDWMMTNVAANPNAKDDIYPNKARPNDETCKIDGVVTAIMSVGRWEAGDEKEPPAHQIFFV